MRAMRKTITQHDVAAWARDFLEGLADAGSSHGKTVRPPRT
jgi:trehalose 6-phosphate synthase